MKTEKVPGRKGANEVVESVGESESELKEENCDDFLEETKGNLLSDRLIAMEDIHEAIQGASLEDDMIYNDEHKLEEEQRDIDIMVGQEPEECHTLNEKDVEDQNEQIRESQGQLTRSELSGFNSSDTEEKSNVENRTEENCEALQIPEIDKRFSDTFSPIEAEEKQNGDKEKSSDSAETRTVAKTGDTDSKFEVRKGKEVDPFTDENSVSVHMEEQVSDKVQPTKPVAPPRRRKATRKSERSWQNTEQTKETRERGAPQECDRINIRTGSEERASPKESHIELEESVEPLPVNEGKEDGQHTKEDASVVSHITKKQTEQTHDSDDDIELLYKVLDTTDEEKEEEMFRGKVMHQPPTSTKTSVPPPLVPRIIINDVVKDDTSLDHTSETDETTKRKKKMSFSKKIRKSLSFKSKGASTDVVGSEKSQRKSQSFNSEKEYFDSEYFPAAARKPMVKTEEKGKSVKRSKSMQVAPNRKKEALGDSRFSTLGRKSSLSRVWSSALFTTTAPFKSDDDARIKLSRSTFYLLSDGGSLNVCPSPSPPGNTESGCQTDPVKDTQIGRDCILQNSVTVDNNCQTEKEAVEQTDQNSGKTCFEEAQIDNLSSDIDHSGNNESLDNLNVDFPLKLAHSTDGDLSDLAQYAEEERMSIWSESDTDYFSFESEGSADSLDFLHADGDVKSCASEPEETSFSRAASDPDLSMLRSKKKKFSISAENLDRREVSTIPSAETDRSAVTRLSSSNPHIYPVNSTESVKIGSRKSSWKPLRRLKKIFRSSPKLAESSVYSDAYLQTTVNQNPIFIASPEEELQEVPGFPPEEDFKSYHQIPGPKAALNPGALTESDLLSWNWSQHADSTSVGNSSSSLTGDYCEIKGCSVSGSNNSDSGKDSDMAEKTSPVEMCEEETQVGHSLVEVEKEQAEEESFPVAYGVIEINSNLETHERDESDKKYYDKINSVLSKPEHKALRSKTLRLSSYSPYIQFSEEQDEVTRLTFSGEEGDNDPTDEEYMDPDEEANEDSSETIAQYHDTKSDEETRQNYTLKADYKLCLSISDEGQPKKEDIANANRQDHSSPDETSGNEETVDEKSSDTESSLPKSEEVTILMSGSDNEHDRRITTMSERTTTDTDECRDMSPPKYARIQPKSVKANLPGPDEASELQLEKPSEEKATDMLVPSSLDTDGALDTQEDVETHRKDGDTEMSKTDPKKEKLGAPTESAVISGPLLVTLALGTEWKRRYLSLVGENLYIWTSHK